MPETAQFTDIPTSTSIPFDGFDLENFWDDCEYALKTYVGEPPTDELIAEIEQELGYKLPTSYIFLMKQHNGGSPINKCVPGVGTEIEGIYGIGRDKPNSLCGRLGSEFWIKEWNYPAIGVAICDTFTAGHDMIFLDYRECGPQGEPKVVHIHQEDDYRITPLADNFEAFIRSLMPEEDLDEDDEE